MRNVSRWTQRVSNERDFTCKFLPLQQLAKKWNCPSSTLENMMKCLLT